MSVRARADARVALRRCCKGCGCCCQGRGQGGEADTVGNIRSCRWRRWQRWCSSDRAGHGGRVAGFGVWACAPISDVGGSGGDCARHGRHAPHQPTASAFTVTAPFPAEAPELRRRQLWPSPSSATAYPCVAPCRPLLERHQRRRSPRSAGARRTSLQGQLRRRAFTQLLRSCPRRACRRGSHALHTSTCVFSKWSAAFSTTLGWSCPCTVTTCSARRRAPSTTRPP